MRLAISQAGIGRISGVRVAVIAMCWSFALASPAAAAVESPGFTVDSVASPTHFSTSGNAECVKQVEGLVPQPFCDAYRVDITNAGEKATDGSPVTITDKLPKGVTVRKIVLLPFPRPGVNPGADLAAEAGCAVTAGVLRCELPAGVDSTVLPDGKLQLIVDVTVDEPESPGPITNEATVSGGGAPTVSGSGHNEISSLPASFGLANFDFYISGSDGARDTLAGDHPYEVTTTIDLNTTTALHDELEREEGATSFQDVKDVIVDLPLGFAGSTLAAPQCTLAQLSSDARCPPNTQVGFIRSEPQSVEAVNGPVWNLTPERGVPGEFGFVDGSKNTHVFHARVAPTPAGYVLQVVSPDIPQALLGHIVTTFYGDPAKRDEAAGAQIPFFTNPSYCGSGPLKATIYIDSWQHPGAYNADGTVDTSDPNWQGAVSESPAVTGCNELRFAPELKAQPTTSQADTPAGLEFELKVPQVENVGVRATPALKNAVVALPEGMTVDPSSGNGLQACSVAQIGWLGGSPFNFSPSPPQCPDASKIGSLELESPLIAGVLTGAIYLAAQNDNPFKSTLATYLVVNDPVTGVLIKIAGEIKSDSHSGHLTSLFPENAQLPFSDLKLHFFGGPRASLATPESCGTYTTTSDLAPWSAPDSGPDAMPFASFSINTGCVSGFNPALTAGSTDLQAGAYSPFAVSFSREDSDQQLAGATISMAPGLSANIKSVPLCPDVQANAGTCPESSQIGTVQAGAGPGPSPIFEAGKAYLTGPYNGGSFGLSVVVPAIAGPFNFGNVIVRQSLRIDPHDAHVTDVSDPFPTLLDVTGANGQVSGIPIKLRRVEVSISRPGFTFNPTSCNKLQIVSSLKSTKDETKAQVTPFQVTNCASLKFAPKVAISTSGHTSKENGASLTFKLTYPTAAPGTYANIAKVKVDTPKFLPSRLTTLHHACLAATFDANPAACPPGSIVGHAKTVVPNLALPLEGPAYFVSHGGESFPSLTFLLQGNNVTVQLVGSTFIKNGITSSTFKTVPDAPVTSFEVVFPQGTNSVFAATADFCKTNLKMPIAFVAQNGLEIHQSTKIGVTGCGKSLTPAQKLARALKACRNSRSHTKQVTCARQAMRQYRASSSKRHRKR